MWGIRTELEVFLGCSRRMQVLLVANMTYALVLPVIEIFVAAYVMRNSQQVSEVVTYQLSLFIATPVAFLVNGVLLGRIGVKRLYGAGMVLSGMSMMLLMRTGVLTPLGIAMAGLAMGLSTGLFWANRGFLALASTEDGNRNYYYGVETFAATLSAVVVPALIGWFIAGTLHFGWMGGDANRAYRMIGAAVFALTLISAGIVQRGAFRNPAPTQLLFLKFPPMWHRMLELALLKGLVQGSIVTAPAMLVMLLVGKEGTLGATQAIGGVISACVLYIVGRNTEPHHRKVVFTAALLLFFLGAVANAILFNPTGVLVFLGCLVLAKPMLDLAYNPIEMSVIDRMAALDERSEYAYFLNHEFALFAGRFLGCVLFLAIDAWWSGVAALKFALPVVALLQLLSMRVAGRISSDLERGRATP